MVFFFCLLVWGVIFLATPGILQDGIELESHEVEVCSSNHRTAREFPEVYFNEVNFMLHTLYLNKAVKNY